MKLITDTKAHTMVREAVILERDRARVKFAAEEAARKSALGELEEVRTQIKALTSQAEKQSETRNNLIEKTNNQAAAITGLQRERDQLGEEVVNKTAIINQSEPAKTIEAQVARIKHLQDQMHEFDHVWSTLCDAAIEVADENGYCEEYDSLVEEVNSALEDRTNGHRLMRPRTKEYYVTLVLEVNIEEAKNEEDAMEQAKENLDNGEYNSFELDNSRSEAREA